MLRVWHSVVDWFVTLFSTSGSAESNENEEGHREIAKQLVRDRSSVSEPTTGEVVDYGLVSSGPLPEDYQIVFTVDAGSFGEQQLVFDIPERYESDSPLFRFLGVVGAEFEDDLDAALGEEFSVDIGPDGTVRIDWDLEGVPGPAVSVDSGPSGKVYVNEDTVDDPTIVDPGEIAADGGETNE